MAEKLTLTEDFKITLLRLAYGLNTDFDDDNPTEEKCIELINKAINNIEPIDTNTNTNSNRKKLRNSNSYDNYDDDGYDNYDEDDNNKKDIDYNNSKNNNGSTNKKNNKKEKKVLTKAKELTTNVKELMNNFEDVDTMKRRILILSKNSRKDKLQRKTYEQYIHTQKKKIKILIEHIEKLMNALKNESTKKMKLLETNRNLHKDINKNEEKFLRYQKIIHTQEK